LLPFAFELEISLDRNQSIVVRPKFIDLCQRPRRVLLDGAVGKPHRATRAIIQRAASRKALHDFSERFLSLSAHRHIDRGLLHQAFARKHGRMPAAPHDGKAGPRPLRRPRYAQRIGNGCTGKYRHPETQGVADV